MSQQQIDVRSCGYSWPCSLANTNKQHYYIYYVTAGPFMPECCYAAVSKLMSLLVNSILYFLANKNTSINCILAVPLISLTSWIIHGQLELRGWAVFRAQVHFRWFIYWAKQGISKLLFTAHYLTACYFYAIVITLSTAETAWEIKSINGSWELFCCQVPWNASRFKLPKNNKSHPIWRVRKWDTCSDAGGVSWDLECIKKYLLFMD